jgi:hypothetical protein
MELLEQHRAKVVTSAQKNDSTAKAYGFVNSICHG